MATELPLQMDTGEPVVADGSGFTVTLTVLELTHPVLVIVSVRVYVVVDVGFAVGLETFAKDSPVEGVQL